METFVLFSRKLEINLLDFLFRFGNSRQVDRMLPSVSTNFSTVSRSRAI